MKNLFKEVLNALSQEEKDEFISDVFHKFDGVREYYWYEFAPKKCPEVVEDNNIRRDTPSETYLYNFCERIWTLGLEYEKAGEVEVSDNFDTDGETLTFGVLTLTACYDPDVNYYDDGASSVEGFIEELKDVIQIDNITYVEDWDFDDECGTPTKSGDIIVKIGGR